MDPFGYKMGFNRTVINGKDYHPRTQSNQQKSSEKSLFAEFKCAKCKHQWKATIHDENESQKCHSCKQMVQPKTVRIAKKGKLGPRKSNENLKGSGPFFVDFVCKNCQKKWQSAYAWLDDDGERKLHQKCKKCHRNVFPENMRKLEYGLKDWMKPHVQKLCAKCKKLGYSCELEKDRKTKR